MNSKQTANPDMMVWCPGRFSRAQFLQSDIFTDKNFPQESSVSQLNVCFQEKNDLLIVSVFSSLQCHGDVLGHKREHAGHLQHLQRIYITVVPLHSNQYFASILFELCEISNSAGLFALRRQKILGF